MSQVIAREAGFFLASFLTGVLLLLAYDIIRGFRRGVPHSGSVVSAEDFFYWSIAGVVVFGVAYKMNNGSIRGFAVAALLLGMVCYRGTFSPLVVRVSAFVFSCLHRGIAGVCRLILFPAGKSVKKIRKIVRKALKNAGKEVKIIRKKK